MKPVVKGLLIGCGALILIGVLIVVFIARYLQQNKDRLMAQASEVKTRGQEFGRGESEPACVAEAFKQYRQDNSLTGQIKVRLWLDGCLEATPRDPAFCAGVPPKDEIMRTVSWRLEECTRLGFEGDSNCGNVLSTVQDHCERRAQGAGGRAR